MKWGIEIAMTILTIFADWQLTTSGVSEEEADARITSANGNLNEKPNILRRLKSRIRLNSVRC